MFISASKQLQFLLDLIIVLFKEVTPFKFIDIYKHFGYPADV